VGADPSRLGQRSPAGGFVVEGTTRRSAWVVGDYVDEVILGLLAEEWDHSSSC
jgi:RimJ/RimL family protein N-acetyltransferase